MNLKRKPVHVPADTSFATRDQELLLRAALLKGADAVDAWNEWKSGVDWEGHLDNGSFRLLPLLFTNLKRLEVKDPLMGKLKGIYLKAWYENQRLFFQAGRILDYLHKEGIRTIVLKGIPLAILHYRNYGVRPMTDIDILVPASQALLTADALKRAGWISTADESLEIPMQYRHSQQFVCASGTEVDLHWNLMLESARVDSASDFWNKAVPIKIQDVPSYALDPTDMLFHVIVHGVKWNPEPPIRWIADAMTIIRSPDPHIDWSRLMSHAKKYMVCLQIKEGLNYLNENFQAPVPKKIMDNINNMTVSYLERLEYRRLIMNGEEYSGTLLGGGPTYLIQYLRLTKDTGFLPALAGFPKYLRYRMRKKNMRHLLSYLVSRSIRISKKKVLPKLVSRNSGSNP
ncbi:MAG: nucleotidyltransferase family protein [Nitrospirota bacterium]|nr:nucleotidyltransferase family protein [Nitrospirota bacterium]